MIKGLVPFLAKASLPHALGTSNARRMPDGSTTITVQGGPWDFHDNFFGDTPYGGRTVISYNNKPYWIMVYYGRVEARAAQRTSKIHDFLRLALQHAPADKPLRGPSRFKQGSLEYRSRTQGSVNNFAGSETILDHGQTIYWAKYQGGLVDQQPGVGF